MSHDDWLNARKNTIGGSEAAALCGMSKYMSPYSVWAEKMGLTSAKPDNEAMRQGRDLEDYVAQRFSEATGKKVRNDNHIIINTDYPFAHANVDRVVVGEDAGLECKTTSVLNLSKFKNGEYPDNYYVQCMHYMMVTGKSKWYLAVLILGTDFKVFEIERDEEEIERLKEIEESFFKCLVDKTPPAIDGSKATADALNEIYPTSNNNESCDLTFYQAEINEFLRCKEQIDLLKQRQEEASNKIKEFMASHKTGVTKDNKVSWATQKRSRFDKKALQADYPSINLDAYTTYSESRVFKIT